MQQRLTALGVESELVSITTSGDKGAKPDKSPQGMKGLFVAEIVHALQRGDVDVAVHSAKDLPAEDPEDVVVAAIPERASPFDVLVTRQAELPDDARVGSSSLRRRGQLLRARPGIRLVDMRGNVDTRLRRLEGGEVDGLVLAAAGLARLGIAPEHTTELSVDEMVPAPGQGALAVQTRGDGDARDLVAGLDDRPSRLAFDTERLLVNLLGGGCALPLGGYARVEGDTIHLVAIVLRADGSAMVRTDVAAGSSQEAAREASERLVAAGARSILSGLK